MPGKDKSSSIFLPVFLFWHKTKAEDIGYAQVMYMKKHNWKVYAFWILLAEGIGALSGWLTREGTKVYNETILQPPLSPPGIVFPIVWAVLYALMGIGAARVYLSRASGARSRGLLLFLV